ncbi:tetratricopeptide repeat protein [Phormidium pseudopriestleyi FRX01]|uniref:Tetratricopeptide repeat protein n=1 Tax=Phormidium pseudopriestleyi FRX01 TaxID=1759528 RepID=A0ABS3FPW7_9CYAN|nr:tetratricopeptide repeat protein [Phormidium pseudopriestleyi]MBO0349159.1 tetratricopeptide repeat protein [Phormidium pseudopriestleyi FRX01]
MQEQPFHELPEINLTNSNRHQALLNHQESSSTEHQEGGQNYEYWKRSGDRLQVAKAYLEAIAAYELALLQKPTACYAWQQRGEVLKRLHRYDEAIASDRKALEVSANPISRYQAWNGLGALFFTIERYEESIFAYKQALALCPNSMGSPHILEMEGIAWSRLNRYLEAGDCYDRAYHKAVEISDRTVKKTN